MNSLHRYLTRPLAFAALAVAAVVTLGEPVAQDTPQQASPAIEALPAVEPVLAEQDSAEAPLNARAAQVSRLRWVITLPSARGTCCRRPA